MLVGRGPELYAGGLTYVQDAAGAGAMLDLALQRPIAFVGIDCEYRFSRPLVEIKKGRWWSDPRSCVPLLMSVALAEVGADGGGTLYRFVVDLRRPAALAPLAESPRRLGRAQVLANQPDAVIRLEPATLPPAVVAPR